MNQLPKHYHRNKYTGEILSPAIQYCDACHVNFLSTEAGDKHRVGRFGVDRRCITPKEAKLVKLINKYGAVIYKRRNEPDPRWEFTVVPA